MLTAVLAAALIPGAALAQPPRDFVGLTSELADTPDQGAAVLAQQAPIGVGIERQPFRWQEIETAPGVYDWTRYDAFMTNVAQQGLHVIAVLYDPPTFRSTQPQYVGSGKMGPPTSLGDYGYWIKQVVGRYGPFGTFWSDHPDVPFVPIRAWQVWNEPDIPQYWEPRPNAGAYASLLKTAYQAIRSQDPGAEVVSSGLPNSTIPGSVPFTTYATQLMRAGGGRYMSTFAVHPYSTTVGQTLAYVANARRILDRYKARNVKIWITEIGWASTGPASRFNVGSRGQADRIGGVIKSLAKYRFRYKIRGLILYNWQDILAPAGYKDFWGLHAGLLDAHGHPKPAYNAFLNALHSIGL